MEIKNYPKVTFKHIEGLTCPECKMFKTRCICKQLGTLRKVPRNLSGSKSKDV